MNVDSVKARYDTDGMADDDTVLRIAKEECKKQEFYDWISTQADIVVFVTLILKVGAANQGWLKLVISDTDYNTVLPNLN